MTGDDPESGGEDLDRDDLESIVAENPEAVATFIDRLDAVNEFPRRGLHSVRARSPTRWSSNSRARPRRSRNRRTGSRPTRPWHSPRPSAGTARGLREAMETLIALQRSGTLDELAEVAEVGSLATAALDDEMVRSLAGTGSALGEVADTAADDDTRDGLKTLLAGSAAPNGAIRNQWAHLGSRGDPRSGGPVRARLRARDLEGDRARTRGDRRRRVRSLVASAPVAAPLSSFSLLRPSHRVRAVDRRSRTT